MCDAGKNPFKSWPAVVDCGDPVLTFLDNTVALKQLEKAHRVRQMRLNSPTLLELTHLFLSSYQASRLSRDSNLQPLVLLLSVGTILQRWLLCVLHTSTGAKYLWSISTPTLVCLSSLREIPPSWSGAHTNTPIDTWDPAVLGEQSKVALKYLAS